MNEPRFYAPDLDAASGEVRLADDESRHLSRVLRLGPGARVRVFDGRGMEMRAEVAAASRDGVRLRLMESIDSAPELRVRITLAQAALKAEAMETIVRDATMLGVDAIVPLVTARTVVPASAATRASVVDRWRRIAISSAKQCGRARVPEIVSAQPLTQFLVSERGAAGLRLMLVEPGAGIAGVGPSAAAVPESAVILAGPEGGWNPEEIQHVRATSVVPWSLGPLTLRAEVAPLAALSILAWLWHPPQRDPI